MKKSLLVSLILAATLPAAASASVVIQQANQDLQEPLAGTPAAQEVKADVSVDNVLGHSAAMTETEFALMAHSEQTAELPTTEHHLDSPEQPSDW